LTFNQNLCLNFLVKRKIETSFCNELLFILKELGFENNNMQAHLHISKNISKTATIEVMSYATFNLFMNNKSKSKKGISPKHRRDLQAFVSQYPALAFVSQHPALSATVAAF
jgi:hypothetical protein